VCGAFSAISHERLGKRCGSAAEANGRLWSTGTSRSAQRETMSARTMTKGEREEVIPNPHTARDVLSVSDGAVTIGFIIVRDGSHFAFDDSGTLIGEFETQRAAVRSIPKLAKTKAMPDPVKHPNKRRLAK
jgi:hypothetical protein